MNVEESFVAIDLIESQSWYNISYKPRQTMLGLVINNKFIIALKIADLPQLQIQWQAVESAADIRKLP